MTLTKILLINGPNINMLGIREKALYGSHDYQALLSLVKEKAASLGLEVECFQSNHEGAIVDKIQSAYGCFAGIIINPAAYTHTSIAILDALKAVNIPTVEVHLTDIYEREDFRHVSYVKEACVKSICGKGFAGYTEAMTFLKDYLLTA